MTTLPEQLPDDLDAAHRLIRELFATLRQQGHLIEKLQHQLEQLLRQRYGKKGERVDPDQLLLFAREILEQLGAETPPADPEPTPPSPAPPKPGSNGHGRKPLPAHLPRRPVLHDVPPEQRACPECGTERRRIGEEVREQIEYVPASLVVLRHERPKYACPACQAHVIIAERLPEPIEKGLPGPGLMAHVAVSKYADHLPLYRQEGIFRRLGVELARSTMCGWMTAAAGLLRPIVQAMLREVLLAAVVQTDDTPLKVQDHEGKGIRTGRLWVYRGRRSTVYDYTPDHSSDGPQRVLKDYKGYLQADACSVYDGLFVGGSIVEVGCWMHARRKFYEARTSDPERAHVMLAWVRGLYDVEAAAKQGRAKHPEWDDAAWHAHRYELRLQRSQPILEAIRAWLDREQPEVLPKSPIGEAISYALNHWGALVRPLEAGFLEIDNGASERALKPVAISRKNWLFAGNDGGGETAAVLMSLCMTCKELGVDPSAYLKDVLSRVSTHPHSRIDELLPDRWRPAEAAESSEPGGRKG